VFIVGIGNLCTGLRRYHTPSMHALTRRERRGILSYSFIHSATYCGTCRSRPSSCSKKGKGEVVGFKHRVHSEATIALRGPNRCSRYEPLLVLVSFVSIPRRPTMVVSSQTSFTGQKSLPVAPLVSVDIATELRLPTVTV
jgi:hypothetical protein